MSKFSWLVTGTATLVVVVIGVAIARVGMAPDTPPGAAYTGMVPAAKLLRVPVTGIYPGATTAGLNPDLRNPLADDPDAAERGMRDFDKFNCSGCHMARGGGGMGPALSDRTWNHRNSDANIYLDIAQGRGQGMPAWGATLPDRTIWELVAYVQSISQKPAPTFGTTTAAVPQSPDREQVPAERMETSTPWQYLEPMPSNGEEPGVPPERTK
jgi:cytochrome c oxidase cbb3-type subunit 3